VFVNNFVGCTQQQHMHAGKQVREGRWAARLSS
jgi:hypothetical protein